MADDKLIEVMSRAMKALWLDSSELTWEQAAQAALAALKAEGWMLVRWERDEQMDDLVRHLDDQAGPALGIVSGKAYNLVGIESPAAALAGTP